MGSREPFLILLDAVPGASSAWQGKAWSRGPTGRSGCCAFGDFGGWEGSGEPNVELEVEWKGGAGARGGREKTDQELGRRAREKGEEAHWLGGWGGSDWSNLVLARGWAVLGAEGRSWDVGAVLIHPGPEGRKSTKGALQCVVCPLLVACVPLLYPLPFFQFTPL